MLAERLHFAALHLMRGMRTVDRSLKIGPAQLSALSVLLSGPKTLRELAEREQVSAPTISRVAAGLVARGLARRVANVEDGRSSRLEMTRRGQRLIERGRLARVATIATALNALDADEREDLARAAPVLETIALNVLRMTSTTRAPRTR
jgi:DNA-binding MarR family transcriptional regulator